MVNVRFFFYLAKGRFHRNNRSTLLNRILISVPSPQETVSLENFDETPAFSRFVKQAYESCEKKSCEIW